MVQDPLGRVFSAELGGCVRHVPAFDCGHCGGPWRFGVGTCSSGVLGQPGRAAPGTGHQQSSPGLCSSVP